MIEISVRYGRKHVRVRFPNDVTVYTSEPAEIEGVVDARSEVRRALMNPIGSLRLVDIAKGKKTAAIAISDFSRATPDHVLLPEILREINDAGIKDRDVTVIIGAALHRPMMRDEVRRKVGDAVLSRVRVVQHDPDHKLRLLGVSTLGNKIWINQMMAAADVKVATGDIVPHPYAGFSAGGKSVLPGVAGRATILRNHLYVRQYGLAMGRLDGNQVREEINEAARMLPLNFVVNTVMNSGGELVRAFAGDSVEAHRQGADLCREIYTTKIPVRPDLLLTSAYPYDDDFYYATKALENAGSIVKDGSTVVMCSPCYRGWGTADLRYFLRKETAQEILDSIDQNPARNPVAALVAYQVALLRERSRVILFSKGLDRRQTEKMQMQHSSDLQRSLDETLATLGHQANVVFLPQAAVSMPVLA
jgi:nickel-dependent lactate racemase